MKLYKYPKYERHKYIYTVLWIQIYLPKKSCIFLGSVGGGRGRKRDKRMSIQQKEVNCILNDEIK